jgi:hypothetical protein
VGSRALFIGAIVVLGAVTMVGAPTTSLFRRAVDGWTTTSAADRLLAEKLQELGRIELAKAPGAAPLVAAFAAPGRPAANAGVLSLAANLTFAALVSKAGFGPSQNFKPLRPNPSRFAAPEFAARDANDPGLDSARGEIGRRLTILQLGDSHTAADFFTGRVRERLQAVFGTGGAGYIVPGVPHPGVRSALFKDEASDGWDYEALQKSTDFKRFYLSGFNAVAHRAGAAITLTARGLGFDGLDVAFLKQPGGLAAVMRRC